MANVTTQEFVDYVASGLRVPAENDRYAKAVLVAINRTINGINQHADVETAISRIDSLNDAEIGIDEEFEELLHDGVRYHLEVMGITKAAAAPKGGVSVRDLKERYMEGISNYWYQALLDTQSNAENDVAGLGATDY